MWAEGKIADAYRICIPSTTWERLLGGCLCYAIRTYRVRCDSLAGHVMDGVGALKACDLFKQIVEEGFKRVFMPFLDNPLVIGDQLVSSRRIRSTC